MSRLGAGMRSRATILVVDDQPVILDALCQLLQDDYDVICATGGAEALELAAAESPDLILLDVIMPGLDGFEVCERLKLLPQAEAIPVVFLTEWSRPGGEERGLQAGAIDYISKPINPAVVKARVRNYLAYKQQQDLLRGLTYQDGMTGIPNRRCFDETLQEEWHRALRTRKPLSLVMMDVDHFKAYNDHYGHAQGDDCLRQVALQLLGTLARGEDLLARFGGEEFVCLLPETDPAGALLVAERLRARVKALQLAHERNSAGPTVSISLGVATCLPSQEGSPTRLIQMADEQLYRAKRQGRDCINQAHCLDGQAVPVPRDPQGPPLALLVEDDKHIRTLLVARLEAQGIRVEAVAGSRPALDFLARERPVLILSDAVMPGMDGFSLCQAVKEQVELREIPFVILTSLSRELRERSTQAGADSYLFKLTDDRLFQIRIRMLMEWGGLRAAHPGLAAPAGGRILLLTRNAGLQVQLQAQLAADAVAVLRAGDADQALAQARAERCAILAIDLDTVSAEQPWLAPRGAAPGAGPVLLGLTGAGALPVAAEAPFQDLLPKPLDAQETRHRVRLLLQLANLRSEAEHLDPAAPQGGPGGAGGGDQA